MPVLCTSTSTEIQHSNSGDGSSWCIYPDGDQDAFVCIQPMEQGEEPSIPRWWYNSVTGTCSQFLWDASQSENVSPNNFRTVEHCESYCRDTCRRGPNQFNRHNRGSLLDETAVTNCLHQTGSCGPEFHCTLIGSHQHCCPTIGNICSPNGGRAMSYLSKESFDAGVAIAGR
uniref:BPTI/Kunitz inhibitor domain-containing protein n=1 Tax=Ditylenchus dipsaci TaxID=166011 RepID=A0A915D3G2_9BILA